MDNVDQLLPVPVDLHTDAHQPIASLSVGPALSSAASSSGAGPARLARRGAARDACARSGKAWLWGFGVESAVPRHVEELDREFIQGIVAGDSDFLFALTGTVQVRRQRRRSRQWPCSRANAWAARRAGHLHLEVPGL